MKILVLLFATFLSGCVLMTTQQDIINRERAKCEGVCLQAGMKLCGFKHHKLEQEATCTCCGPIPQGKKKPHKLDI